MFNIADYIYDDSTIEDALYRIVDVFKSQNKHHRQMKDKAKKRKEKDEFSDKMITLNNMMIDKIKEAVSLNKVITDNIYHSH
jgi:ribosomal protein S25